MNFDQLIWLIPSTLLVVAIIQCLYWIYLLRAVNRPQGGRRRSPVMPSHPRSTGKSKGLGEDDGGDYSDNVVSRGGFQGEMRVLEDTLAVPKIRMPKNSFRMGRFYNPDENILIALDERSISRRHAEFSTEGDSYYLTDTDSSYGTSVFIDNAFRTLNPNEPEQVFNDDVVLFGNTVKVQLRLPGPARS